MNEPTEVDRLRAEVLVLRGALGALVDAPDAGYPEETDDGDFATCLYCGGDYELWHDGSRYLHAPTCPISLARALLEAATATPTAETPRSPSEATEPL